jgi:hypothetical protein
MAAPALATAAAPTSNPSFEIHRGARTTHTTHSEISGAFVTNPCARGGALKVQRKVAQ